MTTTTLGQYRVTVDIIDADHGNENTITTAWSPPMTRDAAMRWAKRQARETYMADHRARLGRMYAPDRARRITSAIDNRTWVHVTDWSYRPVEVTAMKDAAREAEVLEDAACDPTDYGTY